MGGMVMRRISVVGGALVIGVSCAQIFDLDKTYVFDVGTGGVGGTSSHSISGSGGGVPPDGGCRDTCSNDLKTVIDCYGQVKMSCAADEGCYDDGAGPKCVAGPCNAAQLAKSSYG